MIKRFVKGLVRLSAGVIAFPFMVFIPVLRYKTMMSIFTAVGMISGLLSIKYNEYKDTHGQ